MFHNYNYFTGLEQYFSFLNVTYVVLLISFCVCFLDKQNFGYYRISVSERGEIICFSDFTQNFRSYGRAFPKFEQELTKVFIVF